MTAETNIKKRIVWLDILKFGLMLLVILGHSIQSVYLETGQDFMSSYLWRLIYSFHMPAFMAVSGYLAYRAKAPGNMLTGTVRRFKQLIVPFILWSVIMFFVNHNTLQIYDYILFPNKSYWFLWALFFIFIIFNGVQHISYKLKIKEEICIVFTAMALIIGKACISNPKFLGYEYVSYYFIYYSMGYLINKYKHLLPRNMFIISVLAVIWFVLGSYWHSYAIPSIIPTALHSIFMLNVLYRILTATIFIVTMFSICQIFNNSDNKSVTIDYLASLGKISLGLYTVHMVLRRYLVKSLIILLPNAKDFIYISITFILLTLLSVIIVNLLERYKLSALLFLGKS